VSKHSSSDEESLISRGEDFLLVDEDASSYRSLKKAEFLLKPSRIIFDIKEGVKTSFIDAFNKMASNPVGRVLLYRLLIEIRRVDESNKGICEPPISLVSDATYSDGTVRNKARSIKIIAPKPGENQFGFGDSNLTFGTSPIPVPALKLVESDAKNADMPEIVDTEYFGVPLDCVLFHECVHWFHHLRNYARFLGMQGSSWEISENIAFSLRIYHSDSLIYVSFREM
jgi:hypothetical protein